MSTRPVSITHLVFGLIALGITAIWVVGETTDTEAPALAIWGPVVLIAAGAVGLAATLFNSRQARTVPTDTIPPIVSEPEATTPVDEYADTTVLDQEEKS
jgi:hypothetical protein